MSKKYGYDTFEDIQKDYLEKLKFERKMREDERLDYLKESFIVTSFIPEMGKVYYKDFSVNKDNGVWTKRITEAFPFKTEASARIKARNLYLESDLNTKVLFYK